MKEFKETIEELKEHGIEVVKVIRPGTFKHYRLIGPGLDPNKTWVSWQIREAHDNGRLCIQEKGSMRKFDIRIKPGTKVLLAGYGRRGWYTVKAIHSTRKWVEVEGLLGSFQRSDIIRFTNKIRGFGRIIKLVIDKGE